MFGYLRRLKGDYFAVELMISLVFEVVFERHFSFPAGKGGINTFYNRINIYYYRYEKNCTVFTFTNALTMSLRVLR